MNFIKKFYFLVVFVSVKSQNKVQLIKLYEPLEITNHVSLEIVLWKRKISEAKS